MIDKPDLWAVLYLHNPDGSIYPEVHAIYETYEEARDIVKNMSTPEKYHVRRAKWDFWTKKDKK